MTNAEKVFLFTLILSAVSLVIGLLVVRKPSRKHR
jgi:cell division protein FtsL